MLHQIIHIHDVFLTLIPAASVIVALVLGLSARPRGLLIQVIQSLAAGVLLACVATQLLPVLNFSQHSGSLSVAIALGLFLMLGLARLNPGCCSQKAAASPLLPFVTGFSIEFFMNGVIIVLAGLASYQAAMMAAFSLAVCCFVCGLSVTTRLLTHNLKQKRVVWGVLCMAALFPVGGLLAYWGLSKLSSYWMGEVMAFCLAVLFYIATADLLPEGIKGSSVWPKISLFSGFVLIVVLHAHPQVFV
jgi:zinc transporter ZupT